MSGSTVWGTNNGGTRDGDGSLNWSQVLKDSHTHTHPSNLAAQWDLVPMPLPTSQGGLMPEPMHLELQHSSDRVAVYGSQTAGPDGPSSQAGMKAETSYIRSHLGIVMQHYCGSTPSLAHLCGFLDLMEEEGSDPPLPNYL